MKKWIILWVILWVCLCGMYGIYEIYGDETHGSAKIEIKKSFSGKSKIFLETVAGECTIKKNTGETIEVQYLSSSKGKANEPIFSGTDEELRLNEKNFISMLSKSSWIIQAPENTIIFISTVTGDISVSGMKKKTDIRTISGKIIANEMDGVTELNAVSGNIDAENITGKTNFFVGNGKLIIKNISGIIGIKTLQGVIEAENLNGKVSARMPNGNFRLKSCQGSFEIKTASGEIWATDTKITGNSYFRNASGDIQVTLGAPPIGDLTLDSAAGKALLNFSGYPLKGYFEFKAISESGEIIAPLEFDKEEEMEEWGNTYLYKSIKLGSDKPRISILTSTGEAILKQK